MIKEIVKVDGKKFIALFLFFSLLALSESLYAEKKGATLVVEKTDGQKVKGELIAVKKTSLLLLESESGVDVSISIPDIKTIKTVEKSKTLLGVGLGLLTGVGVGALGTEIGWRIWSWAPHDTKTKYRIMAYVGVSSGLLGALVGGHIGASPSHPETIQIEGKSDMEIKEILEKLSSKARIPDYK